VDPTQDKLKNFFLQFNALNYKKGEVMLRAGDLPQGIYYLKKGFAKLTSVSQEGKELTLVVYRAGDFFPVVWTFFGKRASIYSLATLTECQVIRAQREIFMDFIMNNTDVLLEVTKHIITRFQVALRRMEYLTFGKASAKVASILLICGRDFGRQINGQIEIQIPLTHKDIANLVGVTRETISVELKKFDRRGLIDYNQKLIIIKNKEGLEKEAILT